MIFFLSDTKTETDFPNIFYIQIFMFTLCPTLLSRLLFEAFMMHVNNREPAECPLVDKRCN